MTALLLPRSFYVFLCLGAQRKGMVINMKKLGEFLAKNGEEIVVTGGVSDEKIGEMEKSLQLSICKEMNDFLLDYGMILGYGVEILGYGKNGISLLVSQTKRFREYGLPDNYLVIRDVGEWLYCLDNNTGVVYSWSRKDQKFLKCSDSLEKYITEALEEAKLDWG